MAPRIKVMIGRGTGNPMGSGMCWDVANRLDKNIFKIVENPYYASIAPVGGRYSQQQSLDNFNWHADRMNLTELDWWMFIGYSLGAQAGGNYLGTHNLSRFKGAALIADPGRHRDQFYGGTRVKPFVKNPQGKVIPCYGIAGERYVGRGNYPVWSVSAPRDAISECPEDNGLRGFSTMSGGTRQRPARAAEWGYTSEWLKNYGTRHTVYGAEKFPGSTLTYTQELARVMNAEGRRLVAA